MDAAPSPRSTTSAMSAPGSRPAGAGASAPASLEDRVSAFVEDLVQVDGLEAAFGNYLVDRPDLRANKEEMQRDEWIGLLREASGSAHHPGGDGGEAGGENKSAAVVKTFVQV